MFGKKQKKEKKNAIIFRNRRIDDRMVLPGIILLLINQAEWFHAGRN